MDENLLKQEVLELTLLFRKSAEWDDLRELVKEKNLDPDDTFLVGFLEDEHENECGVFLTKEGDLIEYERPTTEGENYFKMWNVTADVTRLLETFPAVEIGRSVADQNPKHKPTK